jgi:hypothetical protein
MSVDLRYELISISAVNLASLLDGLASRMRTTKAMHTDLEEELRAIYVEVENITDKSVLINSHVNLRKFY